MELAKLSARKIVNILFDEFHSESWTVSKSRAMEVQPDDPENSSYQRAADLLIAREFTVHRNTEHEIDAEMLQGTDVLAFLHPCDPKYERTTCSNSPQLSSAEIAAIQSFVR